MTQSSYKFGIQYKLHLFSIILHDMLALSACLWWHYQAHSSLQSQLMEVMEEIFSYFVKATTEMDCIGTRLQILDVFLLSWTIFLCCEARCKMSFLSSSPGSFIGSVSHRCMNAAKKSGKFKPSADVVEITQTHCDIRITSSHTLRWGLCTISVTALFLPARQPHH